MEVWLNAEDPPGTVYDYDYKYHISREPSDLSGLESDGPP
jgi:hypothetical protein